ncbi:tRNA glutamyl-Q(34) synthetase GluQRS [Sphingomonas quercus]|uniref:tRNA glutamyl-Q(34) synthetase GluQRS n=1 Tax=Sphingomonas quercus TaxID=2842451 RepID=A0ABS6BIR5_9SPHN|nr:tRNA glutamyl-Q(34) synthetase GluQRS [Sphingomonas quercus]MBU3078196.1 tRNA glutamyl-Q(34) synthetase GluQRS [Sphingomonas quercus]
MTAWTATRGQEPASRAPVTTRFAPSPTGRLHLGHAFSALLAHDFARAAGGRFLLRIEDIDGTRSRPEHIDGIVEDLAWLGLRWDESVLRQTERLAAYAEALGRLRAAGLVYPCFCTRSDIAAAASAPHGPAGALYPGTCRALAPDARAARLGEPHAWRLDIAAARAAAPARLFFDDGRLGRIEARPERQGDIVLARKDAPSSYHLAATLDDAWTGVTDVVRGEDLVEATHVHRLLQALLGLPTPRYHHHRLLAGADGRRLAKRDGAPSLAGMRAAGADPAALVAELRARAISLASDGEGPTLRQ